MKKILLIAFAVLLGALVVNTMLGGFDKVEVELVEVNGYHIYGQPFSGRYNSDELEGMIAMARKLVNDNTLEGELVIVNYVDEKSEKRGEVKQFVGVQLNDTTGLVQLENFELLTIKTRQAVEARIGVRKLVMPSPEKIKKSSVAMAQENNLELMKMSIETYMGQHLIVHYPIQQ